jgi:hypothetical protein
MMEQKAENRVTDARNVASAGSGEPQSMGIGATNGSYRRGIADSV